MRVPDDRLVGQVLGGRYRVERVLNAGGMGAVFEATQLGLERRVAIKAMHPYLGNDREMLERFVREARVVAGLGHPGIVQVYDFAAATATEPAWIAMELVAGRSLATVLKEEGALSPLRAVPILISVLGALEAAHAASVIHRDLKPGNVMVARVPGAGEVAKLLDFGIAKLSEGDGYAKLTQTGAVLGTPRYMPPEQALARGVDARSDVYSVGMMAWAMLAGRSPLPSGTPAEVLQAVVDVVPPPLATLRSDVPPALDAIVQRAIAKSPDARFPSARAMADALRAVPLSGEVASPPASPTLPATLPATVPIAPRDPTMQAHAAPPAWRGPALVVAVGLGALALLVVAAATVFVASLFTASPSPPPTRVVARPAVATPQPPRSVASTGLPGAPTVPDATLAAVLADARARLDASRPGMRLELVSATCVGADGHIVWSDSAGCGWMLAYQNEARTERTSLVYMYRGMAPFASNDAGSPRTIPLSADPPDTPAVLAAIRASPRCHAPSAGLVVDRMELHHEGNRFSPDIVEVVLAGSGEHWSAGIGGGRVLGVLQDCRGM